MQRSRVIVRRMSYIVDTSSRKCVHLCVLVPGGGLDRIIFAGYKRLRINTSTLGAAGIQVRRG